MSRVLRASEGSGQWPSSTSTRPVALLSSQPGDAPRPCSWLTGRPPPEAAFDGRLLAQPAGEWSVLRWISLDSDS